MAFDIFGEVFQFHLNGNLKYTSQVGTILTIILFIATFSNFIINMTNMINYKDLNINSYQTSLNENDEINLENTNAILGFSLTDTNFKALSNENFKYFNFTYSIVSTQQQLGDTTKSFGNLILCEPFLGKNDYIVKTEPYLCVDLKNLTISGNYYSFYPVYYINIFVKLKNEYINSSIANSLFPLVLSIHFPFASLDLYNYSNPFSTQLGWNSYHLDLNNTSYIELSYQLKEFNTDSNFIGSSKEKKQILSSDYKFVQNYPSYDGNLSQILFYINPEKIVYFRKYKKFQDVMNNVSSFWSILLIIFKLFAMSYNRLEMRNSFIEKYINTKEVPRVNLQADENKESNEVLSNNEFTLKIIQSNKIIKKTRNKMIKVSYLDLRPSNQVKMDILTYLYLKMKYIFCNLRGNQRVSLSFDEIIVNFYESLIDVGRILTILDQFDNYKKLAMSNYQLVTLNNSKIILDLNNYDENDVFIDKNKDHLHRSFEKLKSKLKNNKLSKVDSMILNKY